MDWNESYSVQKWFTLDNISEYSNGIKDEQLDPPTLCIVQSSFEVHEDFLPTILLALISGYDFGTV